MRFLTIFLLSFSLVFSNTELNSIDSTEEFIESSNIQANEYIEEAHVLDETPSEQKPEIKAKLLYQSYFELPKKLFRGQVFPLTIKTLSAKKDFDDIIYEFSSPVGLKTISDEPQRKVISPYFYDTFYFQVTGNNIKTPKVTTSLIFKNNDDELKEVLDGVRIDTVKLNPEKDFSSVLADEFKILEYKTTQYDDLHNIVVFSAEAKMANLNEFSLKIAKKENIDSYEADLPYSKITYYAVVTKQLDELKFTYFNIQKRRFINVVIPIIVHNDMVSTQTDLAPTQNTHVLAKIVAFSLVSILGLILFIIRRNKLYLLIFIIPLFFIANLSVPTKYVCINKDSSIYLLPIRNGTIFEKAPNKFTTESLAEVQDFTKIRMKNKQIGWVKDEDLCKD